MSQKPVFTGGAKQLAVDVARSAHGDESVIVLRAGDNAKILWAGHEPDTMALVGQVARYAKVWEVDTIKIDSVGVGGGPADRLRELGHQVICLNAGASADDNDNFLNVRGEMFWNLRERIGTLAIGHDDELFSQLANLTYKPDSRGKIRMTDKRKAGTRGSASPDRADAIAMAFYDGKQEAPKTEVVFL